MDDLERALDELAERGRARGAHRVFDDATQSTGPRSRRRPVVVLAAAAIAAVVTVGASIVLTHDDRERVQAALLSVVDPAGTAPARPFSGIGGVLVGAGEGPSVLWSEDRGHTWSSAALESAPAGGSVGQLHRTGDDLVATIVIVSRTTSDSVVDEPRADIYEWHSTDGKRWTGPSVTTDMPVPPTQQPDGVPLSTDLTRAIDDLAIDGTPLPGIEVDGDLLVPIVDAAGHLVRVVTVDQ